MDQNGINRYSRLLNKLEIAFTDHFAKIRSQKRFLPNFDHRGSYLTFENDKQGTFPKLPRDPLLKNFGSPLFEVSTVFDLEH